MTNSLSSTLKTSATTEKKAVGARAQLILKVESLCKLGGHFLSQ